MRWQDDVVAGGPGRGRPGGGGRRGRRGGWPLAVAAVAVLALTALGARAGVGEEAAAHLRVGLGVAAAPSGEPAVGDVEGDGNAAGLDLTVADTWHATVANLAPELRAAVADATADARADGVEILVRSGWRSSEYQARLLDEAVVRYGTLEEASRWVASPDTSRHVLGEAVDVGPTDAAFWMAEHGARYGLCQAYANEVWHYELLTEPGGACPQPRADSSS